jgi:mono/diheme cytochrome c family protein
MTRVSGHFGKWRLGALALAVAAVPLASAWASAEGAAPAPLTEDEVVKARQLFNDNACGQCHALADASAEGAIGPAFDGNATLNHDYVVDRVTNGQGAMPGFGWLPAEEIDLMARYIVQVKK